MLRKRRKRKNIRRKIDPFIYEAMHGGKEEFEEILLDAVDRSDDDFKSYEEEMESFTYNDIFGS